MRKTIIIGFAITLLLASNTALAQILGGNGDLNRNNPPPHTAVPRPQVQTKTGQTAGGGVSGPPAGAQGLVQQGTQVLTSGGSRGQNQNRGAAGSREESRYWNSYFGIRYDKNSIFLRDQYKRENAGNRQTTRNPDLRQSGARTMTTTGTTLGTANAGNAIASPGGANSGSAAAGNTAVTSGGMAITGGETGIGSPMRDSGISSQPGSAGGAARNAPANRGTAGNMGYGNHGNPMAGGYPYGYPYRQGAQSYGSPGYSGPNHGSPGYGGSSGYGNPGYGPSPWGIGAANPGAGGFSYGGGASNGSTISGSPNGAIGPSIGNPALSTPGTGYPPAMIGPSIGNPPGAASPGANAVVGGGGGGSPAMVSPTRGNTGPVSPSAGKKNSGKAELKNRQE